MPAVAKAFIFDADGKVLILRRSETHPSHAFHPDLPGGEVEEDETAEVAAAREISEEVGLEVAPESLTLVYDGIAEDGYHQILYIVELEESQPEPTISWEHDQWEWLPVHHVVKRGLPATGAVDSYYKMALQYLQQNHL